MLRVLSWAMALLLALAGTVPRAIQGASQLSAESAWRIAPDERQPLADRVDVRLELRGRAHDGGPFDHIQISALTPVELTWPTPSVASVLLEKRSGPLLDTFPQWSGPTARAPPRG